MRLVDLTDTIHPGGWADIVGFMIGEGMTFTVEHNHPLYTTHGVLNPDEIDGHIAGLLAVRAYEALREAGWFGPGDLEWALPCKEWVKNYEEPKLKRTRK
jgi:hypothetical protein